MIKVGLNIGNSKISCAVSEIEKNNVTRLDFLKISNQDDSYIFKRENK